MRRSTDEDALYLSLSAAILHFVIGHACTYSYMAWCQGTMCQGTMCQGAIHKIYSPTILTAVPTSELLQVQLSDPLSS